MVRKKSDELIVADEAHKNAVFLDEEPSKETRGEKKRKALQLERLGELLVKLPPAKLARVPMPDDLAAAVTEARRIEQSRGGYRRQINFIGRIMRTLDAQPIAEALEKLNAEDAPNSAASRAAELWRARLLADGDAALEALVKEKPAADRTALRQLMRAKSTRAIFKELRALFGPPAP